MLDRLKDGRVPANEIPAELLDHLRRWGWVIGQERLELTNIGRYHAGEQEKGLLGWVPSLLRDSRGSLFSVKTADNYVFSLPVFVVKPQVSTPYIP